MDCLFCKISQGEIPCYKIYEDDFALAFLDIHPHAKGHTVIIPKKHFSELSEFSAEDWTALAATLFETAKVIRQGLNPEGMNIGVNDRPAAGQVVPHVHWHILPRFTNDGGGSIHSIIRAVDIGEVAVVHQEILNRNRV